MLKTLLLLLILLIEIVLLLVILFFFLLGILGVFLPVVPGVLLAGAGIAIYSLMIKKDFGTITPKIHKKVLSNKTKITALPITQKTMGIIKNIRKKKDAKVQEEVLKHGIILLGFNFILVLSFIFTISSLSFLLGLTNSSMAVFAFTPLIAIFIFAALSAVVWYRFGQILGQKFKKRKVLNSTLVVFISILPLLLLLFILSSLFNVVDGFKQEFLVLAFLSIILISILGAVFELLIVSIGAATARK